jgi:hypothetical protein
MGGARGPVTLGDRAALTLGTLRPRYGFAACPGRSTWIALKTSAPTSK